MLDLVAFELHRMGAPSGDVVAIEAASPVLTSDLKDRLGERIELRDRPSAASTGVFLLGTGDVLRKLDERAYENVIIAFKNAYSHKSILYPEYGGISHWRVERRVRASYTLHASWGIMPPSGAVRLLAAGAARRRGLHGLADHLADRATLSPVRRGLSRRVCSIGVVVGRGR